MVFYQTDWDIVGLKLRINEDEIFQIPLKTPASRSPQPLQEDSIQSLELLESLVISS